MVKRSEWTDTRWGRWDRHGLLKLKGFLGTAVSPGMDRTKERIPRWDRGRDPSR